MTKKQQKYQFFRHDFDAMLDDKITELLCEEGMEGYGIYWGLLELMGKANDYRLPTKYKSLAFQLHMQHDAAKVQRVVEKYDLFIIEDGTFYSRRFSEQMQDISDKYKRRAAAGAAGGNAKASRQNNDSNANEKGSNATKNDSNANENDSNATNLLKKKSNQKKNKKKEGEERNNDLFPSDEVKNRCCCGGAKTTTRFFDDRVEDETFLRIVRAYMKKGAARPSYEAVKLIDLMHPAWQSEDGRSFVGKEEQATCFWEVKRERKYIDGPRLGAAQCRAVDEFIDILSAAGVHDTKVIDAFRGSEYDAEHNTLVWSVADKVFITIMEDQYLQPMSAALIARYGNGVQLIYRILTFQ